MSGTVKYTAPASAGLWAVRSAGTSPANSANSSSAPATRSTAPGRHSPFAAGTPYADYATWNVGVGFTWKVFTLDLRYYDTDLSKGDCTVYTSDYTATIDQR